MPDETTTLEARNEVVFDFQRQAWFPGSTADLSAEKPALARLNKPVTFETRTGMRSHEIDFEIVKRFHPEGEDAPQPEPQGE